MSHNVKSHKKSGRNRSSRTGRRSWVVAGALAASAVASPTLAAEGRNSNLVRTGVNSSRLDLRDVLPEFRGAAWLDRAGQPATAWSVAQAPAPKDDPPLQRFDIAPGPLEVVLAAFTQMTGVTVRISDDRMKGVSSPGVSGLHSPTEALQHLLTGTGLVPRFLSPTAAVLDVQGLSEAIEVTGRVPTLSSPKFTEPLRDIPQTITVIPQAVIEQQGATTLRDVLRNVAGITFQAGEGGVPAGDQLTIRGFSARTDMFIDGVRDFGGYSRDSVQPRAGRGGQGPVVGDRRTRLDRRRDQPGEQGADARQPHYAARSAAATPTTSAAHARHQPAAGRHRARKRRVPR